MVRIPSRFHLCRLVNRAEAAQDRELSGPVHSPLTSQQKALKATLPHRAPDFSFFLVTFPNQNLNQLNQKTLIHQTEANTDPQQLHTPGWFAAPDTGVPQIQTGTGSAPPGAAKPLQQLGGKPRTSTVPVPDPQGTLITNWKSNKQIKNKIKSHLLPRAE